MNAPTTAIGCLLLFGVLGAAACQTTVLHFVPPENRGRSLKDREPALSETHVSLGLGIYEYSKSPQNPCPDSLESIVIRRDWLDATIHFFVGGVYTTRRIEFYCRKSNES